MLPGEDGLSICRQVRPQFDGRSDAHRAHRRHGRGARPGGAPDDCVCASRCARVCCWRASVPCCGAAAPEAGAPAADGKRLAFGRLVIDNAMREAWLDGTTIELTSAEFDLLWLLAANAGRILSREEIFNALRVSEIRRPGPLHRRAHLADPPEDRRRPDAPAADQDRAQQGLPVRRRGLRRFPAGRGGRPGRPNQQRTAAGARR